MVLNWALEFSFRIPFVVLSSYSPVLGVAVFFCSILFNASKNIIYLHVKRDLGLRIHIQKNIIYIA